MKYQGIKIYDKITIVERTSTTEGEYNWRGRTVNQGFAVDFDNKSMLETAKNWALWHKYPSDEKKKELEKQFFGEGKDYWSKDVTSEERVAYNKAYQKLVVDMPGIIHEYKNGEFELILDEAAGYSSQGGKLSFWNCIIKAPDGQSFLIGISSELLLHLMMSSTFINGVCQEKVWLGRIRGSQVGVFTPDMEDFKQAKFDEEARNRKTTSCYNPGDIVKTLESTEVYLGTVYIAAEEGCWGELSIYKNPPIRHVFVGYNDEKKKFYSVWFKDIKKTKPKRLVVGHIDINQSPYEFIENMSDSFTKKYLVINLANTKEEALAKHPTIISQYRNGLYSYQTEKINYID